MKIRGMIFKNEREKDGKTWFSYSLSISSKNISGEWKSVSVPIRFRKGVVLINKSRIEITDGWPIVIEYKDRNVLGFFANEFEVLEGNAVEREPEGFSALQDDDIPF